MDSQVEIADLFGKLSLAVYQHGKETIGLLLACWLLVHALHICGNKKATINGGRSTLRRKLRNHSTLPSRNKDHIVDVFSEKGTSLKKDSTLLKVDQNYKSK